MVTDRVEANVTVLFRISYLVLCSFHATYLTVHAHVIYW